MSKIAFLYPGQGAQKTGMGKDFYEKSEAVRNFYQEAGRAVGLDMEALCFEKNELLDQTEYTQAALVTTCLAMTQVLMNEGVMPDVTAGLSLGEYAAIATAGGMNVLDAVRLVRKRGILMQNTVPPGKGAMYAVIAMDEKEIEDVLAKIEGAEIANYNCPGQIVITGETAAVEEAARKLKEAGARRVIKLNVSGPFHSSMLKPAGLELQREMEGVSLHSLNIPYITNVTAELVKEKTNIKQLLVTQVSSPVRWMQSMEVLLNAGVEQFVEIGPGRTLAGFMKKINPEAKVYSVSKWEDVGEVRNQILSDF